MAKNDDFVSYLLEMLQGFGQVRAKAMFGGYGIYHNELVFAIVVDSTLYIKADDKNRELFNEKSLPRFSYIKKGKECFMSYYMVPDEAIDDVGVLNYWARIGYQAALRANRIAT